MFLKFLNRCEQEHVLVVTTITATNAVDEQGRGDPKEVELSQVPV